MNYDEALAWLYQAQTFGIKLGLENIHRLLLHLEVDVARPRFIHVAGTNGKGSVCAMIAAICRAGGFRTGLFTSPHLVEFRERVQVDGVQIPEARAAELLTELRALTSEEFQPTFFELTTALALRHFQEQQTDVVALETGMGGRLDSTNCVMPSATVITPIALDHQAWLGHSLAGIACEKAGIIKPGVPVVSAPQLPKAADVLTERARQQNAPLLVVRAPSTAADLGLRGEHQRWNAAVATEAVSAVQLDISPAAVAAGLRTVHWPGRFQLINNNIILDGAHNPAAAEQLVETWNEAFPGERPTVILGMARDKEAEQCIDSVSSIASSFIAVPIRNPRSFSAEELARLLSPTGVHVEAAPDFSSALETAQYLPAKILVTGSLFLVGEALSVLQEMAGPPRITSQ